MNIITIICIITISLLAATLTTYAGIYRKFFKENLENTHANQGLPSDLVTPFTVSVSDYISKMELPAIVFNCKGKELLFILDTGSNGCHINKSVINELGVETTKVEQKEGVESLVATGNGVSAPSTEKCDLDLSLGEYEFNVPFSVDELDDAFDFVFRCEGVRIHGILGTNFLQSNNWTIDFANKVAYPAFQKKQSA